MSGQSEDVVGLLLSSVSCIGPLLLHALLLGEARQRSESVLVHGRETPEIPDCPTGISDVRNLTILAYA